MPDLETRSAEREAMLDRLRTILIAQLQLGRDPDELDPDAPLFGSGLGLDSLDAVEVLIGLEIDLGIKLEGDDPMKLGLRSVNGVVDAVMRARGEL